MVTRESSVLFPARGAALMGLRRSSSPAPVYARARGAARPPRRPPTSDCAFIPGRGAALRSNCLRGLPAGFIPAAAGLWLVSFLALCG